MESKSAHPLTNPLVSVFCFITSLITPVISSASELPHEFSANYKLVMYGTVLARAKYTLEHTENGLLMTQSTRPAGLVALLRDDKIDVRSKMTVKDGQILLDSYDYNHTGDNKDRNVSININWLTDVGQKLTGKAVGMFEGKPVNIDIDRPVWDPLSIQIPIMLDAAKSMAPHEHGLFLKGEFKHYLFENHGADKIVFNSKEYHAVKIAGRETKRDRAMYTWIVPELHYLPVKIEQWKDGKINSTVMLESATFNSNGKSYTINSTDDIDDL